MASGTQVDLDWAATDTAADGARGGAGLPPTAPNAGTDARYLTDEEILGIEPTAPAAPKNRFVIPSEARNLSGDVSDGALNQQRDSSGTNRPRNEKNSGSATAAENGQADSSLENSAQTEVHATVAMPAWMQVAAADPQHGAEAATLWREHHEFRSAFASPEEARAVKELLPGGVRDVLALREATQSVERIDAALFSGDARAQAEVVAELARANPAAFRSLFAEAAKLVAGGLRLDAGIQGVGSREAGNYDASISNGLNAGPTLRETPEEWGTREARNRYSSQDVTNVAGQRDSSGTTRPRNDSFSEQAAQDTGHGPRLTGHESEITNHESRFTIHESPVTSHAFDSAAYAAFERATNDAVARDVRGAIGDTLSRVLPEGVAEGAARRIGEDIFHEIHRALAADRTLSEQVAAALRDPVAVGRWRFGGAEQQRVALLLAGRAKQLVPSVARRVIGEWTSSVLNTSRSKAARQATAASRVDIAAPGGSRDSMPLREMNRREVDYAKLSDEEILGM